MSSLPLLTLFGAYTRINEPSAPQPLVVELGRTTSLVELLGGVLTFSAVVRAEGLAEGTPATVRFAWRAPGVQCRLAFGDDAGSVHEAVLDARFDRRLARSLTELSGLLFGPDGAVLGSARLRMNWRARR